MNEVTEWSCSEWIMSDDLFLHIGRYWYPLNITQIVECVGEAVKIIVDVISKLAEAIRQSIQNFMDTLPNICIARPFSVDQYRLGRSAASLGVSQTLDIYRINRSSRRYFCTPAAVLIYLS